MTWLENAMEQVTIYLDIRVSIFRRDMIYPQQNTVELLPCLLNNAAAASALVIIGTSQKFEDQDPMVRMLFCRVTPYLPA